MAYFSLAARLGGDPVTVDTATWEHGVALGAGQVVGSSATVQWTDGASVTPASQVPHPLRPGWSRTNGTACSLDLAVDGAPRRVFTGQVEDASGSLTAGSSSRLTDHAARLDTAVEVPPIAYTMPARNLSSEPTDLRRVGLFGTWITQLVMAQAGFQTCQSIQFSSVWYQSMAGSVWTAQNPDHVTATLGVITTAHRLGDPTTAPQVVQGTHQPCMEQVYVLGSTGSRRRSTSTSWQLTVDMASDAPTVAHTGRVDVRTLPQSAGAGVRFDWDHSNIRIYRRDTDGSTTLLGVVHRAVAGEFSMRWSLVVRQDGTATLHANDRLDALQISSHGIQLPDGPEPATVIVESEGPCGAVQVTRSDATSIVTQGVSGRIYRSSFQNRSLPGYDYRPPTSAASLLVEQANAERSLLGMPLWLWIDRDGHLVNADPAWLADQPISRHFSTHGTGGTPLTRLAYAIPPSGPHQRVDVTARRGSVIARRHPTVLLHEGRQKNHDHGDSLAEFLHPEPDTTWLEPDMRAYLAGRPYPSPPFPPATQHEFNRAVGSWVGGMLLDEDGGRLGWIEPQHVDGWSIAESGHVSGSLESLDHRTIHHKGTFVGGTSRGMSSMPDQGSSTLWAHRAMQALPQIRGGGRIDWNTEVEQVVASGNAAHPVLVHDTGMWCQTGTWRRQIGEALAQASLVPPVEVTLTVGLDPDVTVGDRVTGAVTYPDGARLDVDGLVAGVSARVPSAEMTVRLVLLAHSWTDSAGVETEIDYDVPPPPREVLPPKDRVPPPVEPGQEGGGLL